MVGRPLVEAAPQLRLGEASGAAGAQSAIDGHELLLAWQRVAGYPNLLVFVSQPIEIVLNSWWRFATITGACWLVASLALGVLGAWLGRVILARGLLENRYRTLFDSIPHPVIVSDTQTSRILAFNEAAGRHYGWAAGAADNEQLRLPTDLALLAEHRANLSEERAVVVEGQRQRNGAGQLVDVDLTLRRIEYNRRHALLTIAVDVTSRKEAERAHQAAEDRLRQAQRMELMGQLTGGVAHDFNNILMVIEGNVESLLERRDGDPETVRLLAQISDSAQHAEDLTRQMLAFSRKLPLRPRPTDLNDLVVETGKLLRRTLGEQIEIDSILTEDLWRVDIDRAQLETSLVNLCLNARDAMPRGGRLLIETRNVHLDPGSAEAQQAGASGDCVVLSVTDTGEGIPPEIMDKIFEPFFTTKTTGKSSGLGLSMVYGFVRQSKGHIEVASEPGRGTVVRIYLPRSLEVAQASRGAPAISGGTERVLVVEDDESVRSSVIRQLRSLGYAVTEAPDGDAALAAFERPDAVFDLLLTDVIMPGAYNGDELATEILRRWPRTKVVFMSGYTGNTLGDRDVLLLAKPFRKADLATILRTALEGEVASTAAS
jgi:PAS domain S-box